MEATIQDFITHPTTIYFFQILIIVTVVGFSSHKSAVRLWAGGIIFAVPLVAIPRVTTYDSTSRAIFFGFGTISNCLQYLEVALLSQWDFDAYGPPGVPVGGSNIVKIVPSNHVLRRLLFGLYSTFSYRCCGTSHEIPRVPPFNPNHEIPSRMRFCCETLRKALLCYLWLDLVAASGDPVANQRNYAAHKVPFFSRLNELEVEEVAIRIVTVLVYQSASYCFIHLMWTVPAVLCVGTGLTSVSWWAPQNSQLSEAYTIRKFWGTFWHQSLRQRFSHPASYLTLRIFRLRKNSLAARYIHLYLVFLISGAYHIPLDYVSRIPLAKSGAMRFFLMQAVGITIEDFGQYIWRYSYGVPEPSSRARLRWFGYVWTLLWIAWTEPAWSYPLLVLQQGEKRDELLPFSLVKMAIHYTSRSSRQ